MATLVAGVGCPVFSPVSIRWIVSLTGSAIVEGGKSGRGTSY